MSKEAAEFVIYIINIISNMQGYYPSDVYRAMDKSGCISTYLVPLYDVLHTMSSEQVAKDVLQFIENRGVTI